MAHSTTRLSQRRKNESFVISGRLAAFIGILMVTCIACKKISPQMLPSETNTVAKSGHGNCVTIGKKLETSGVFDFPIDPALPNSAEAVVFLGSLANGEFNLDELRDSIKRTFAGTCNLTTYVVNLKYFITATIYDLHGNLIFLVQDNKWQIFKNSIRKYNYDDNGFEVFDKDGRIAMSIDFRTFRIAPALYVKGIIPCTSSSLTYYSPEDFFLNVAYGTRELNRAFDNLYNSYPIQPLFRYTGNDWQHARL